MKALCVKLFSDPDGQSHFEDLDIALVPTQFVAEAAPLFLSAPIKIDEVLFFGAPVGWTSDWHPSSGQHLFSVISGRWEVEASDGEVRQFFKGDILFVEDTSGKGHRSRIIGDEESIALLARVTR